MLESPESLQETLRDGDPEQRRRAVLAATELPLDSALPICLTGLADPDWRVRKEAVGVAIGLGQDHPIAAPLVEALCQGENVGLRNSALEALGRLGDRATFALRDALHAVPVGARKFVIEALGDTRAPEVVPALVREAEGDDANAAAAAIDALARVGGPAAEAALRRRLGATDPFQRMAALDGLARLDAVVPWSELEPLLGDRLVRRVALGVLGRTGHPDAVDPLAEALGDSSNHIVAAAACSLVQLSDADESVAAMRERVSVLGDSARAALRALLVDGHTAARQAAAQLVLVARDRDGLQGVVSLAAEGTLQPEALGDLRRWGVDAIAPLLEVAERSRGLARAMALELASDLGEGGRIEECDVPVAELRAASVAALADADPTVAAAAARSLSWWVLPEDAVLLVDSARAAGGEVAQACGGPLESLAAAHPEAVLEALEDIALEGEAGTTFARALAIIGGQRVSTLLLTGLSAEAPETRRAAVDGLASVGGARAAELVAYALTDEDVDVRSTAARVLGSLRDDDGIPVGVNQLLLALSSGSPAVQAAAAEALAATGSALAIDPLRDLTRSRAPGVAVVALEALRALSDPGLDELLVDTLGHDDPEVVKQALAAIRESGGPRTTARLSVGLSHGRWDVRAAAAGLLATVDADEARGALVEHRRGESDPTVLRTIDEVLADGAGEHG